VDVSQRNDSDTHITKTLVRSSRLTPQWAPTARNSALESANSFSFESLSQVITSVRRRILLNGSMQSFFRSRGQFFWVILALCFCLGAYLRLHNVGSQVLVGDEWHLVHRLTYYPLSESMRTFGYADFGIPLAVLFTPIMKWVGLSETTLRVPMLLAGIASAPPPLR
jgi:hypothetical protein